MIALFAVAPDGTGYAVRNTNTGSVAGRSRTEDGANIVAQLLNEAFGLAILRCNDDGGVEVYNTETKKTVFGPASWDTSSRMAGEINTPQQHPQPAAPCCDCCARTAAALEHLMDGLEHVLPTMEFADQGEVVLRTIAETRKIMRGGKNG